MQMLLHISFKPRPNFNHQAQKEAHHLWQAYQVPEGVEIKSLVMGPNNAGFALVEANSSETAIVAMSAFSGVYFDYEIVPVIPIDQAVPIMEKTLADRESVVTKIV
jgi:hypothetical protein